MANDKIKQFKKRHEKLLEVGISIIFLGLKSDTFLVIVTEKYEQNWFLAGHHSNGELGKHLETNGCKNLFLSPLLLRNQKIICFKLQYLEATNTEGRCVGN